MEMWPSFDLGSLTRYWRGGRKDRKEKRNGEVGRREGGMEGGREGRSK